ncbi:anthranilate synthase component I [Hazenella coriacea]|uniref:Anthranilate synthase component 1 n=1 Tax=Hazenella coriacea TaxID=1179467 RepID=A0A4R3L1T5_9BACL|nr:anthranilate synthase component I [Hazenella coriacea]TCS93389.1 anthranilate synthase component 1 [Hazenella coriacea]
MFTPSLDQVLDLTRTYSSIPICKTVYSDTVTPMMLLERLPNSPYTFLLESAEDGKKESRYSYLGTDPFQIIRCLHGLITITESSCNEKIKSNEPLKWLSEWLRKDQTPVYENMPPFLGGALGYLNYDSVRYIYPNEKITQVNQMPAESDDFHFMMINRLMVFDHVKKAIHFVVHLNVENVDSIEQDYSRMTEELENWISEIFKSKTEITSLGLIDNEVEEKSMPPANLEPEQFMKNVEIAKEAILAGDLTQVVLSQRFKVEQASDPLRVYRILRVINPSPYMFYLRMGEETLVGTSPELLLRANRSKIEVRPIAGSRPRGKTLKDEKDLVEDLLQDPKERAEHMMLVDLGRNDLERIAKAGTVEVTSLMKVEKYSHIMHLVSHIQAELHPELQPIDALMACFPAGTVSGAPRIRAMEMISELEPGPRGVYAGAIGCFSFSGSIDTCIAIRTIVFRDGCATIQAGAGIVADSHPENEYWETVNKAKGMIRALHLASEEMEGAVKG